MKKNILIVDDDKNICHLLSEVLVGTFPGFKIMQAHDGADGLWKLRNQKFDLLIVDIKMPKKNGLELIEYLRKNEKDDEEQSEIILISGFLDKHSVSEAVKLKVKNILQKPFTNERFVDMVRGIVGEA